MLFINEWFLQALGINLDDFGGIWIVLMVVGAILAGIGINTVRKRKDWLNEAQKRQNAKYEYTDPVIPKVGQKWNEDGWYYDEEKGKWVSPDYSDASKNTSWKWNEGARMWVDATQMDQRKTEAGYEVVKEKWNQLRREEAKIDSLRAYVYLTPEERELAKQIQIDRSHPSFEEWKAAQMKKPPDGAYHYDYIHIPNNETITEVKILKPNKTVSKVPEVKTRPKEPEKKEEKFESEKKDSEQAQMYEARPILTQNEARNYRTLLEAATRKGYTVNIKPRLADIATPRNKDQQYMANFRRISQKHVDFVILDANTKVRAVIELDDSSHDTEKGKKRDAFVDTVLKDCGYKIIHTRYIWIDILDDI